MKSTLPCFFMPPSAVHTGRVRPPWGERGIFTPNSVTSQQPVFEVTADLMTRTLILTGEFDAVAVDGFAACAQALVATGPGDVRVELAGITFIDAAGMGALVGLRNEVVGEGAVLSIHNIDDTARRALVAAGLEALMGVSVRRQDAPP